MEDVTLKIIRYLDKLNYTNKYWYKTYINARSNNMIKTMEFIKKHCFKEESDGKHECVFCYEKTTICILFDNCKHIFMSCFCCKLEQKINVQCVVK